MVLIAVSFKTFMCNSMSCRAITRYHFLYLVMVLLGSRCHSRQFIFNDLDGGKLVNSLRHCQNSDTS